MLAVPFFGKQMKIMLVMTNYAKNYASTISIKAFSRLRQQKKIQHSPANPTTCWISDKQKRGRTVLYLTPLQRPPWGQN